MKQNVLILKTLFLPLFYGEQRYGKEVAGGLWNFGFDL